MKVIDSVPVIPCKPNLQPNELQKYTFYRKHQKGRMFTTTFGILLRKFPFRDVYKLGSKRIHYTNTKLSFPGKFLKYIEGGIPYRGFNEH